MARPIVTRTRKRAELRADTSSKRASVTERVAAGEREQPWADRPGFSQEAWAAHNMTDAELDAVDYEDGEPTSNDCAAYRGGVGIGKKTARDYIQRVLNVGSGLENLPASTLLRDLLHDTMIEEAQKRGCAAGFMDQLQPHLNCGIRRGLSHEAAIDNEARVELAIFGDNAFAFEITDDGQDVASHLVVITKALHALSRVIRAASDSDVFKDGEKVAVFEPAQDGLNFLAAMAAIFAEHVAGGEA